MLHTIFTLNYDFVDEEEFTEDQKKRVRDLLCATAESLALATKSELELASMAKTDDSVPPGTPVAVDLAEVVAQVQEPAAAGNGGGMVAEQ